jgi:two-component system chemotaxis sensor kinase CheA
MDDLLREFLTETNESLDVVDVELVRFEQEPNNNDILANIFRLVHTIKGTCGFLGLPRLEALAHAAETLMGKFRDGLPVTSEAVSLILKTIDRIKEILGDLSRSGTEPEGADDDLIAKLVAMSERSGPIPAAEQPKLKAEPPLVVQALERELRPGEVSLDDLERAFRETEIEVVEAPPAAARPARPTVRQGPAHDRVRNPGSARRARVRRRVACLDPAWAVAVRCGDRGHPVDPGAVSRQRSARLDRRHGRGGIRASRRSSASDEQEALSPASAAGNFDRESGANGIADRRQLSCPLDQPGRI